MVRKLYKQYIHHLARVARGLPISWRPNFATVMHSDCTQTVAWSSCGGFIAVGLHESTEVLDAVTLKRLHTFVHPFPDIGQPSFSPDGRSLTWINSINDGSITWDLQTGGRISVIPSTLNASSSQFYSSAYSMDGKVLAVAGLRCSNDYLMETVISTYDLISGTHIYSHRVWDGEGVVQIWTHGEFLRFATVEPGSITIWQVGFTSKHTLAEIESLPAPDDIGFDEHLFLPTLSRIAFTPEQAVLIWDARDSKFLLNFVCGGNTGEMSFSPDGRFFACQVSGQGVCLWKESPTGYVLYRKLVSNTGVTPSLSPDGESIILSGGHETQLWRTTDPINPPPSNPPQPAERTDFILAFSPGKSFMVTGRLGENIATIVDLESGDPRLIVDTGMKICGLGVTGSTVIVIGEGKIITWNLPARNRILNTTVNIHDSVRTVVFQDHQNPQPSFGSVYAASISPDFNYLAILRGMRGGLDIYDMSTGKQLVGTATHFSKPWFTRDGREVWDSTCGQKIVRGEGSDVVGLEPLRYDSIPSGGPLWESPRGHNVADDGWILDPRKKRLMWLPHHWRVSKEYRVWDGRFLALFDPGLPEPVIIEMYR